MTTTARQKPAAAPPRGRLTVVYLIHEAFRRDLARLSGAVRAGTSPERARRLRDHWSFVETQLHHHHEVEDAAMWPLLRPKLVGRDAELAVLDEMEADHETLDPDCQAVGKLFAAFADAPTVTAGEALADALDALGASLGAHLDKEETRSFPVIDETLSAEEFEAFGKATAKAVGMRGSAAFFPWIFDGADDVECRATLGMVPPPVRLLCRYVWQPRYRRRAAVLWG